MRLERPYSILTLLTAACAFGPVSRTAFVRGQSPASNDDATLRDYLSANGLLNRGLYELAAADYVKFLTGSPKHEKAAVARYGLAVCLYRMQQHEAATVELGALRKLKDFEFAAETATLLGQCELALKHYDAAAVAFGTVVHDFGSHDLADDAAAGAAEALYAASKHDAASEQCRQFTARWPESPLRERVEFFWGLSEVAQHAYAPAAERFATWPKRFAKGQFVDRAALLAAQCHQNAGALDQAAVQYRKTIDAGQSELRTDALLGLASILVQQGKPAEAAPLLDELLTPPGDRRPATPAAVVLRAKLERGRVYLEQGQLDRAAELFDQVAGQPGELRDDARYWGAKCKLRRGDFAGAAEALQSTITEFPASELLPELLYDRALALSRGGQPDATFSTLEELRSRFPKHALAPDALHLSALAQHQQQRYDQSQALCFEFQKLYPKHALLAGVRFLAAENDFLAGRYAPAAEGYRRFLEQHAADAQALRAKFRLGTCLYRLDKPDEATPLLSEAAAHLSEDAAYRGTLLTLGDIAFGRGDWKQAEQHFQNYLTVAVNPTVRPGVEPAVRPASADDALLKLGLARQRQERFAEAIDAYDQLLKQFENSGHRLQAIFERGQSLLALKKPDDAAEAFERVLSDGADSRFAPYALQCLAALSAESKDYAKAAERYELAAKKAPADAFAADAVYQRAAALFAAQQFQLADEALAAFIKTYPSHVSVPQASAQRAIALSRQDRCEDALTVIQPLERSALGKLDTGLRTAVVYEKAWCLRKLDRADEAAAAYRRLIEQKEADPALVVHGTLDLAVIESEARHYDAAAKLLRPLHSALGTGHSELRDQVTYRLAVCEFEIERFDDATALFEELTSQSPESSLLASASYFCGESLLRAGKPERAVPHLTRLVERFPSDPACPAALLRLGECLAAVQRWPQSERAFAEYLERFAGQEQWFQAQFGLGYARENQQRYDEAVSAYRAVVDRHKGPTAARAQFQIGECLFAQKKFTDAVGELLKVDILYAYPEWSAAALYEAGRCFEELSKPGEARTQFQTVRDKYKETKWAKLAEQRLTQRPVAALPGRE